MGESTQQRGRQPHHTAGGNTHPALALVVIAAAQLMVVLDGTIVNIALPSIQTDLAVPVSSLAWIVNAYALAFGGLLLLGGKSGDLYGRRRMFRIGVVLFIVASGLGGFATNEAWLIGARVVQGIGGAIAAPTALSLIAVNFQEGTARNRAMGVYAAMAGVGATVGLLLGGVLTDYLSWRWVFFVNVPIGVVVLALAPRIIPESSSQSVAKSSYDVQGAVAITLGTMALVFTLIKADSWGWTSTRTIAGFVVAAVLIVAFVVIERGHDDPLVPLRIFSNRSLSASDATMLLVVAALFGMFFFVTLYLQQVLRYSALKTGVAYLPLSLTLIGASGVASQFVERFTPKPILVAGLLIATGGFVLLTSVSGHGDYASHVLPAMIILGVGFGMSFVPITIAATSGVAPGDSGLASGLLNTTQQVGGSLGLAILSSVSTSRTTSALHAGQSLPAALTHGFTGAFVVAGILCVLGAVVAITLLPSRHRATADEDVEMVALSFAGCPGAPYCGHLARVVAFGRRVRPRLARS